MNWRQVSGCYDVGSRDGRYIYLTAGPELERKLGFWKKRAQQTYWQNSLVSCK